MTDQEHADAVKQAAKQLEAAIKAATDGGLAVSIMVIDYEVSCGFKIANAIVPEIVRSL